MHNPKIAERARGISICSLEQIVRRPAKGFTMPNGSKRARALKPLLTAVGGALCVYLYFVGFYLGSRGEPALAASAAAANVSIGDIALTFAVAPFLLLPAALGLVDLFAELPQAGAGTALAVVLFGAAYAALRRRTPLPGLVCLLALLAYALGFAVEFVLTAHFGLRTPPVEF
jgi:hypothetical protein